MSQSARSTPEIMEMRTEGLREKAGGQLVNMAKQLVGTDEERAKTVVKKRFTKKRGVALAAQARGGEETDSSVEG